MALAAIVGTFCLSSVCAQQDVPAEAGDSQAIHDSIRGLRDRLLQAVNDRNVEGLLESLHPDVVLTAQDGSLLKTMRGHEGVREYMERLLTGPNPGVKSLKVNATVDELTILHGDDTGVAFGSSADNYELASGSTFTLDTRWTATVVRTEGQWKLAALQVSSNPFENPFVSALRSALTWTALVAGIVGLAAGLLISIILRRVVGMPRP